MDTDWFGKPRKQISSKNHQIKNYGARHHKGRASGGDFYYRDPRRHVNQKSSNQWDCCLGLVSSTSQMPSWWIEIWSLQEVPILCISHYRWSFHSMLLNSDRSTGKRVEMWVANEWCVRSRMKSYYRVELWISLSTQTMHAVQRIEPCPTTAVLFLGTRSAQQDYLSEIGNYLGPTGNWDLMGVESLEQKDLTGLNLRIPDISLPVLGGFGKSRPVVR